MMALVFVKLSNVAGRDATELSDASILHVLSEHRELAGVLLCCPLRQAAMRSHKL
jgi:hypothetical protein